MKFAQNLELLKNDIINLLSLNFICVIMIISVLLLHKQIYVLNIAHKVQISGINWENDTFTP